MAGVLFPVFLIFLGCMCNNFVLELIINEDSGAGPLLTLLQFLFVTSVSLPSQFVSTRRRSRTINADDNSDSLLPFKFKKPTTPIYFYLLLTSLFFVLSVINNKAFDYNITQPIHMLFRSSSLTMSFLIGKFLFGKKYSWQRFLGVALVSIGISLTLTAEATLRGGISHGCSEGQCDEIISLDININSSANSNVEDINTDSDLSIWLQGIALLTIALFLSSLLGHIQEHGYDKWGRDTTEGMFYSHLFSLPFFLLITSDIQHHIQLWSQSDPFVNTIATDSWVGVAWYYGVPSTLQLMPKMWIYACGSVLTQLVCIRGVYSLLGTAGSLTCSLTLTLRKFVSILVSLMYFENRFTNSHWLGVFLVFGGVLSYGTLGSLALQYFHSNVGSNGKTKKE